MAAGQAKAVDDAADGLPVEPLRERCARDLDLVQGVDDRDVVAGLHRVLEVTDGPFASGHPGDAVALDPAEAAVGAVRDVVEGDAKGLDIALPDGAADDVEPAGTPLGEIDPQAFLVGETGRTLEDVRVEGKGDDPVVVAGERPHQQRPVDGADDRAHRRFLKSSKFFELPAERE